MRKPLILGVTLVGLVSAIVVWGVPATPTGPDALVSSAGSAAKPGPAGSEELSSRRVRRLGAEERKQLGAQIATARQRFRDQAATYAGDVPSLVDDSIWIEQTSEVKAALEEARTLLDACYESQPAGATANVMTTASDPELDDCVRTASQPTPLLEIGGILTVRLRVRGITAAAQTPSRLP